MSQSPNYESPAVQPAATIYPNEIPISFPKSSALISKLSDVERKLKELASSRSRLHEQKIGLLVRWEDDDTAVENDLKTMESTLSQIGVKCHTYVILSSDKLPAWNLNDKIRELISPYGRMSIPSLFVFYYAGQARLQNHSLHFTTRGNSLQWRHIHNTLQLEHSVDSLAILDCCYAGVGRQTTFAEDTNIHVIARCGTHEVAANPSKRTCFTQRLSHAMRKFKGQGEFTTAEWYQQIQLEKSKDAPHAVFETLSGTGIISLKFSDDTSSRLPQPFPRPISGISKKYVLVKLTLEGERDVVESFSRAVRQLPPHMKVEIRDAFETDASVFFVLQMSWQGWVLWTSITHLEFIGATLGPSLVSRAATPPVEASGENIPIGTLSLKDR